MGEKGMSFAYEAYEVVADLRQREEEESALSYARRFQVPGAEGEKRDETFRFIVAPKGGESATIADNFASTTGVISAQGSLALEDFSGSVPQPFSALSNVVVVTPYDWSLRAKPWSSIVPGAMLNTLLWVKQFERAEQGESERKGLVFSQEVVQFCSHHRIFGCLQLAVKLVHECFPSAADVSVEMERDPESDDEWLLMTAQLRERIEAVLRQYDTYTRRFIASVPWPQRNKIRFNYDLV
jgi:hypothetical protein